MRSLLEKLGQDPRRSIALFSKGLGLFIVGVMLILLGYYQQYWWQIPGIFFLALGSAISAWAYLGIFANRLLSIFNKHRY
jgi:hypothetical protein